MLTLPNSILRQNEYKVVLILDSKDTMFQENNFCDAGLNADLILMQNSNSIVSDEQVDMLKSQLIVIFRFPVLNIPDQNPVSASSDHYSSLISSSPIYSQRSSFNHPLFHYPLFGIDYNDPIINLYCTHCKYKQILFCIIL